MDGIRKTASVALMLVIFQSSALAGPSFDCARHTGLTERVICANPELGDLDGEMSKHYFDLINGDVSADTKQWAKVSQRDWLRERNRCGANIACLQNVYQRRVNELSGTLYGD
jgi:uncharacterized protein